MINHVVSREVAEKLKGYLPKGLKSHFCYQRIRNTKNDEWYGWNGSWEGIIKSPSTTDTQELNAPTLSEILELLPKFMTVPSKTRAGNEVVFIFCMNGGRNGDGRVGLMSYDKDKYTFYKALNVEVNLATAAAKLYMWLIDEGHVERGTKID
jgi:hypothetical protein